MLPDTIQQLLRLGGKIDFHIRKTGRRFNGRANLGRDLPDAERDKFIILCICEAIGHWAERLVGIPAGNFAGYRRRRGKCADKVVNRGLELI